MNTPLRGFLLSLAIALPPAWPQASVAQGPVTQGTVAPSAVASSTERATTPAISHVTSTPTITRVELRAGKLTLQARDAPMFEVISRIAALAGFEVVPIGELSNLPRVTRSLSAVALHAALDRILAETNSIVVYAPASGAGASPRVSRVLLLGRGAPTPTATTAASDRKAPSAREREQASAAELVRSESMLRLARQVRNAPAGGAASGTVVDALAQALANDEAVVVRVRAAMALGALGDRRGLDALEAATRDPSFSVRAQAITALGQIPDARSADVLGGILVDPSAKRTERLVAAHALWSHNSSAARQYLQAGAADPDEQVRRASSRAPISATSPASARSTPSSGAHEGPAARR